MSMYSCDFIRDIVEHLGVEGSDPPDVQFVEGGYLFLASSEGEGILRENHGMQRCVCVPCVVCVCYNAIAALI